MPDTLWFLFATICSLLAMGWLALAMPAHWQQVFDDTIKHAPNASLMRALAIGMLFLSAYCCLQADHFSMAILVWVLLLVGSGMTTGMILSYMPHITKMISPTQFFAKKTPNQRET